ACLMSRVSSLSLFFCRSTGSISSRIDDPPRRSRPSLTGPVGSHLSYLSRPGKLGAQSRRPIRSVPSTRASFQGGKRNSMSRSGVVRGGGLALVADVDNHRADKAQLHPFAIVDGHFVVPDLGDLTDDPTRGDDGVALFQLREHLLVLLGALALRA